MHLQDRQVFRRRLIDNRLKSIWIRDRMQGHPKTLRAQEVLRLVDESDGRCSLCSQQILFENYKHGAPNVWSIDRIDRSKPHAADNVRLTCLACNLNPPLRWARAAPEPDP
jgi:hypothetical protein